MSVERPAVCSASAFEQRYRSHPDPWNFATSEYERGRYRAILNALPRSTYQRAFEPGCSVGELTAQLAAICGEVLATDIAPSAVARARQRCAARGNTHIECADLAAAVPAGPFDLIVFSEIGYYFAVPELVRIGRALAGHLSEGGDFVAVHWLGSSDDHPLHGNDVHAQLLANLPLHWRHGEQHAGFRVDVWRRT